MGTSYSDPGTERKRVELATEIVKKFEICDKRRLNEIVTGDETQIFHFESESKQKNKVWTSSDGKRPVIARRNKTVSKTM